MSWLVARFALPRVVGFLTSPAGKVMLIVLAFVAWTVYQRVDATATCNAEHVAADQREALRQTELAQNIARAATERADEAEREAALMETENEQLKELIESGEISTCDISDDARERLLRIR